MVSSSIKQLTVIFILILTYHNIILMCPNIVHIVYLLKTKKNHKLVHLYHTRVIGRPILLTS